MPLSRGQIEAKGPIPVSGFHHADPRGRPNIEQITKRTMSTYGTSALAR